MVNCSFVGVEVISVKSVNALLNNVHNVKGLSGAS